MSEHPLDGFLPPVRRWFETALGEPTLPQSQGWPAIRAGQHTLILAPTASGKTLAAFLACLDGLWRQDPLPRGVQILYVSPLKALNNDIYRNLQVPLEGVAQAARETGFPLPTIEAAVRTGDTPASERQRLVKKPPHVLITTPESLNLILTSRARETLRTVTHCIVDEIHALCPNKRGVFLSLLLERLVALTPNGFARIGLSATQLPLEEVARFLGGSETTADGQLTPRPVTIVDAGLRKDLDLLVVNPVEQFGPLPERTIWPSIYRLLFREIQEHRSTLIFANNRRTVERITANLNEMALHPGSAQAEDGEPADEDLEADLSSSTAPRIARAHHGSVSLEIRQQIEQALKEGRLPAVVATASLELGIDMGTVNLVCQVESPGNVARGLQRVGRAGHLVGQKSKGRLIPKNPLDLLEQAVLAAEMAAGRVEEIRVPINCLDVLAQQVVAVVAMDPWEVPALYGLVRRTYPFRDLSPESFEAVLEMVSGRYQFSNANARDAKILSAFHPRVSWDRVHNRLLPLPGSQQLALVSGGTIPDTGQYAAFTASGTRIGELDEEFIYERRVGDTFALGTSVWRLDRIEADRVIVVPAEGQPAIMPFWRGERSGRSYDLGLAVGRFLRTLSERLEKPDCLDWLRSQCFLDNHAARNLKGHVTRQLVSAGYVPTDQTLAVEAFRDPLGDWQMVVLCPFGNAVNLALRLAIEARLTQRLGYGPQCLHHDDGVLIRLSDTSEPILDVFEGLTPEIAEGLILEKLADSALFALRFRQNAARALLLPRLQPGKRAPLWLQRLRGRDLLQVARKHRDFPIVAETFRECLHDHLDLPRLQQLLADLRDGKLKVVTRRADAPSPFAADLLFAFTAAFMYQYDRTDPVPGHAASIDQHLLEQLIAPARNEHLLDPRAIQQVERRLRGVGLPPRSPAEMAEWLRRLGDLTPVELEGPMAGYLAELEAQGVAKRFRLSQVREPERWILAEDETLYRQAFQGDNDPSAACVAAGRILERFLHTHALVGLSDVLGRYPFEPGWARRQLEEWVEGGRAVTVPRPGDDEAVEWSAPANLEQVQRGSLAILRREVMSCPPFQFADFLLRWQALHPASRRRGPDGLSEVLDQLQGLSLPATLWEQVVFPCRLAQYQPGWLDEALAGGEWTFGCGGDSENGPGSVGFWRREDLAQIPPPPEETALDPNASRVLDALARRGALFLPELAQESGSTPGAVRAALWTLLRRRLVSNDRFDLVRRGMADPAGNGEPSPRANARPSLAFRPSPSRRGQRPKPEGRWFVLPWGHPTAEALAVHRARVLLFRYGLAARDLAVLDPEMPAWRVLYEVLSRMELAGEVRRGYFVEGISGAQFALPEAAQLLAETALPSAAEAPPVLVNSLDPANLYGSGAPLDFPLLDNGTRPLLRRAGNWLVLRVGRPVLVYEKSARKVTTMGNATLEDVAKAVVCLPGALETGGTANLRNKLTVEEWNGQPVTAGPGKEFLEAAGFVRDYQGMTLYAAWR